MIQWKFQVQSPWKRDRSFPSLELPFVIFRTPSSKQIYTDKHMHARTEQKNPTMIKARTLQRYHLETESTKSSLVKKWSTAFDEKHFNLRHSDWKCFAHKAVWSNLRDFYNLVSLKCQGISLPPTSNTLCAPKLSDSCNNLVFLKARRQNRT